MKKLLNFFLSFICLAATSCSSAQVNGYDNYSNNNVEVNYQTFYDQLQPYGNWIDYPGIGYVWQPDAGASFRPYETNGHWVSTVDGWAWASNYDWGWAPFHYGRWLYEPAMGWAWVPGYEWAPAWVTWGQYGDDYAWAPLAPGISISVGSTWRAPYNYWSFIPRNYINYSNPSQYIVRNRFNQTVVNNITIINNYNSYNNRSFYHRGPDYHEVEKYTHHTINPLAITASQRPGAARINQRQFQVYRPAMLPNSASHNPSPARVRTIDEVRDSRDARIGGAGNGFNRGNGIHQNNGSTDIQTNRDQRRNGDYRNGNFNNNSPNLPNNPQPAITDPSGIDATRRAGRFQRNNEPGNWNRSSTPTPSVVPPQSTNNAPNNDQPNRPFRHDHLPQSVPNNQAQQNNSNPNQPIYQNRNFQRGSNMPQQNNNNIRGYQRPPSVNPTPATPPARAAEPIQRPERAAAERVNGRE